MNVKRSPDYWNARFGLDGFWESAEGRRQNRELTRLAIDLMPDWLGKAIHGERLTLCDWGCALGDSTAALSNAFGVHCTGLNFDEMPVEAARFLHPDLAFSVFDALAAPIERWDVTISSVSMRYHADPWVELERIASRTNDAVVLLVPFDDQARTPERRYPFSRSNIPTRAGEFQLLCAKSRPTTTEPGPLPLEQQILLVYGSREFVARHRLSLTDMGFDDAAIAEELARLTAQNQDLIAQQAKLTEERLEADRRYEKAEQQVHQLWASRSWKISAPLRAAAIAVQKARAATRKLTSAPPPPQVLPPLPPSEEPLEFDSFARRYKRVLVINSPVQFDPTLDHEASIALASAAATAGYGVIFVGWQQHETDPFPQRDTLVGPDIYQVSKLDWRQLVLTLRQLADAEKTFLVTVPLPEIVQSLVVLEAAQIRVIYHVTNDWVEARRLGKAAWFDEAAERHLAINARKVTAETSRLGEPFIYEREAEVVGSGDQPSGLAATWASRMELILHE